MKETEFLFYGLIGMIFIAAFLYAYLCSIKKTNKELRELLEQTFDNEQRIADKLEIAYKALKDANQDIQRNNQEHIFNGRIRMINAALKESKPEYLEF